MSYSNAPRSAWPVIRILAAGTRTLALTTALVFAAAPFALAQQPAPAPPATPPAKPKPVAKKPAPKPATPAPAQPAPAPAAQQPPPGAPQQTAGEPSAPKLIYTPWVKFCRKDETPGSNKQVCFTGMDARLETGMIIGNLVVMEMEGDAKKAIVRISVPIAVQLPPGTRLVIDQGKENGEILTAPFRFCGPNEPLCFADYEASPEVLARFKKSQMITLQAFGLNSQALSIPVPMTEFAKAYDGPPVDPKVFQAQQEKLQEELQKKADDARKKLEQQGAPAAQAPQAGKTQ